MKHGWDTRSMPIAVELVQKPSLRNELRKAVEADLDREMDSRDAAREARVLLAGEAGPEAYIELAKKPTCTGECIKAVADVAKQRGLGEFRNEWDLAEWTRKQTKKIDPTSPPRIGAVTTPAPKIALARVTSR
jgi:hypothetical protein